MCLYFILQLVLPTVTVTYAQLNAIQSWMAAPESSDFAEVMRSPFFVDKTMMISDLCGRIYSVTKEFIPIAPLKIISPPQYGKSTIINMVKRFLEIPVDAQGNLIDREDSPNYKLFKNNKLDISGHEDIFHDHFGQYSVILIECKLLSEVEDFDHLIEVYQEIVKNSFLHHKYLLSVESLWASGLNKTMFETYMNEDRKIKLNKFQVHCAFSVLAKALLRYFERPVFVLMDDGDAIEVSPAYKEGEERAYIHDFIKLVNDDIFSLENRVKGGIMTATLRKGMLLPCLPSFHVKLPPLKNIKLARYYGLSIDELRKVLTRFLPERKVVDHVADVIVNHMKAEEKDIGNTKKTQVCSVSSIIDFFKREVKWLENVIKPTKMLQ